MKILLVSPKSSVWSSRTHIHMGLGYLAGALLAAGYDDVTLFEEQIEDESLSSLLARERFEGNIFQHLVPPEIVERNMVKTDMPPDR